MIMQSNSTDFAAPASQAQVDSLAANLRERNFEVVVVDSPAEVKGEVLARISSTPCTTRPACWRFIHDATSVAAAGTLTFMPSTYAPSL